jgi:hypothetical protein
MEIQRFKGSKNSNNSDHFMLLLFPVPDGVPARLLGRSTPVSPCLTPVSCLDTVVLFRTAVLSSAKNTPGCQGLYFCWE